MRQANRTRRRQALDPWSRDPRDPLELLARLAGRCSIPSPGRTSGGTPLSDADLALALGMMPDPLESALALAVATRTGGMVDEIARLAFARVVRRLARDRAAPVDVTQGEDRHRVRVVLLDAIEAEIWPERRKSMSAGARAAKMRRQTYVDLFRHLESAVHQEVANARRSFAARLWMDHLLERVAGYELRSSSGACGLLLLRSRTVMEDGEDVHRFRPALWMMEPTVDDMRTALRAVPTAERVAAAAAIVDVGAVPNRRLVRHFAVDGVQYVLLLAAG